MNYIAYKNIDGTITSKFKVKLYEVTDEQKVESLGDAPDEGMELQSIIDIATAD